LLNQLLKPVPVRRWRRRRQRLYFPCLAPDPILPLDRPDLYRPVGQGVIVRDWCRFWQDEPELIKRLRIRQVRRKRCQGVGLFEVNPAAGPMAVSEAKETRHED